MIALLAAMNYMLYEARFLLNSPAPARYIASSAVALILCSISFIPLSIFGFVGKMKITAETLLYLAGVTFTIYVAGRSLSYIKATADYSVNPTDEVKDKNQVS